MQLSGEAKFANSVQHIWDALHDPEILKGAIPGCERLDLTGQGEYDVVMKLGVAAVKGEYTGKVKLEDVEAGAHYILLAEGSGSPGHVKAKMDCKLLPTDKGCTLVWNCDAEIGGMIASVGGRVLGGIAKFMAGQFFKAIEKQVKNGGA
ncbi:carbon monoxide dehydrogenase subunit G [Brevibacillus panacihumi W25]|uniref:Carbon monoxide dehydrogenase subunit G n=1 Tax=Brevibacillus panacihumi W25 TaxID=1408254 RepID=V6LYI4_9BACL|nr:carbon monoxide dehydrogenase subunit G [Brevibacillus panacihumi]EST51509.1 carbon monoxide dehydrogenase subunit G [Brevibacillus panacihumi W25]